MEVSLDKVELVADIREQILYLQELGVDAFDVEIAGIESVSNARSEITGLRSETAISLIPDLRSEIPKIEIPNFRTTRPVEPRVPGQSRLASLPSLASLSKKLETALPIVEDKQTADMTTAETMKELADEPKKEAIVTERSSKLSAIELPILPEPTETIEQIRAEIGPDCTRCKLSTLGRSKVVNSTGNFNAELMFVGEAPGADEDEQGFPFVGRAGKLLTDIMMAIGFSRDDVFIGNINRCRPPGNRAPEPDETIACKPFLKREIAVVRPKVIVVLGATAAQNLLETKVPIGKLRGQFHDYLGTKVMPTFHPAYLLRDPHKKREVWEDMKMVRDFLAATK